MTRDSIDPIACPVCGTVLSLVQLLQHEDTRYAFARLAEASIPLGARVLQYITLFAPPKTRLTLVKQIKLVHQLLPAIERQVIEHKGRAWSAPHQAWAQAIDQMLLARDQGRLELPMSGHGYLYAILAGMADKHEAQAEQARETQRRQMAVHHDPVQVRGQSVSIGEGLQALYGERDPALRKIEADSKAAVPMPAQVREQLDALRAGRKGTP